MDPSPAQSLQPSEAPLQSLSSLEKRRLRKQLKRKRKRQREAKLREEEGNSELEEQEEDEDGERGDEKKFDDKTEDKKEPDIKKRVFGIAIPKEELPAAASEGANITPLPDPDVVSSPAAIRQARSEGEQGLRCAHCLVLLCRDDDFDYVNGRLRLDIDKMRRDKFVGVIMQSGKVYCPNMHHIGKTEATTWAAQAKFVPLLFPEETTFEQNYLKNPAWVGSEKIINKPKYAEKGRSVTPPKELPEGYYPRDEKTGQILVDRYHQQKSPT